MRASRDDQSVYGAKGADYYGHVRLEIVPFLPPGAERVLEIGCAAGGTLRYLKEKGFCRWAAGVEVVHEAAEAARAHLDAVFEGDIEAMDIPVEPASIDALLCLDVFEHLVDPWRLVPRLERLVKPGGVLIAIIPNVRNARVVLPLLFSGTWRYGNEGILDSTHIRFFTKKSAMELLESAGLRIDRVLATNMTSWSKSRIVNALTLSLFKPFLEQEYLIRAVKGG